MAEHAVDLTNGEHDEEVEDLNEEARSSLSLPPVLEAGGLTLDLEI